MHRNNELNMHAAVLGVQKLQFHNSNMVAFSLNIDKYRVQKCQDT